MITEHNIDGIDASGNRAQWEINALKKNEFPDVTLIDKFDETKIKEVTNGLVHAQQLSGRFLNNAKYIVDAHGLEYDASSHLSHGYPVY